MNWTETIEKMFAASAFAEEGEFETAATILKEMPTEEKKSDVCPKKRPSPHLRPAES